MSASDAAIAATNAARSSPRRPSTTTTARSAEPEGEPQRPCRRRREADVEPDDVRGVRVVPDVRSEPPEQVRVVGEAREADHRPRDQDDVLRRRDTRAQLLRPRRSRRARPRAARGMYFTANATPTPSPTMPCRSDSAMPRRRETKHDRHASGLDGREHRRPQQHDAVTAPIANADEAKSAENRNDEPRLNDDPRDLQRKRP